MSERHITFPPDARFLDPETGKPVKVASPDWTPTEAKPMPSESDMVDHPDRSFEWWLNVYILTHRIFSFDFFGYEASKAMKEISKSCEDAIAAGATFFTVTADQDRRLKLTMAKCPNKDVADKEKSLLSVRGMNRKMSNFEAGCFIQCMDALMNSSTNKPTQPALPPAQSAAMEPEEEAASVAN